MTWEGEGGGFYFRLSLSLFDVEMLMEKVRRWWGRWWGQKVWAWIFFKSLIDRALLWNALPVARRALGARWKDPTPELDEKFGHCQVLSKS